MQILILYASAHGQTERIARRLADALRLEGHSSTLLDSRRAPLPASLDRWDAVMIAGSVHFGRHLRPLASFVRHHRDRLNRIPTALISVSGVLCGPAPEAQAVATGYIDKFLRETGFAPSCAATFAGGLPYTRYGPFTRWMMRTISLKLGRPTDTSRDWECTDWEEVTQFGVRFAALLGAHSAIPAGGRRLQTGIVQTAK